MGKFREVKLSEDILNTESWLSDEDIMNIFFEDYDPYRNDNDKIDELNHVLSVNSKNVNSSYHVKNIEFPIEVENSNKAVESVKTNNTEFIFDVLTVNSGSESNEIKNSKRVLKAA